MSDPNYDNAAELEAEGIPALQDSINEDEGLIPPRDHYQGAGEFGITAAEERSQETVADRLFREEPEVSPDDIDEADADLPMGGMSSGRFLAPGDEDVDALDDEKDVVASEVIGDGDALSAEEAAMHVTDQP